MCFKVFFGTFSHKVAQTWFILHETWQSTLFGICCCVQVVRIVICKKLWVKLRFYAFLSVFDTFAHKVAHTWFVLRETCHTTLFGLNYCVEVARNENHSHMLEFTC